MKKTSFVALATCVLLALSVVAGTYALSPDNNIILAAINNAVATLQNSITSAQDDVNAHTDALAPKSIFINISMTIDPDQTVRVPLLSVSEGKTFSGHIALVVFGDVQMKVYLYAIMPSPTSQWSSTLALGKISPSINQSEMQLNVDFSGIGLNMFLENDSDHVPQSISVDGVIQYMISTDLETVTSP